MSETTSVAVVWQRFLPYHLARIRRVAERVSERGWRVTGIEVASQDRSYGFPQGDGAQGFHHVCAFPGKMYHDLSAGQILRSVLGVLRAEKPDLVLAPATPFPEGMAALRYGIVSGAKAVLMDDAWELTDQRGWPTHMAKRALHRACHAVLIPAATHRSYYRRLGFPPERIVAGVDVVDNETFGRITQEAREDAAHLRREMRLPPEFFLYAGRFLPRKGLSQLLGAYREYRARAEHPWPLVLVGTGDLAPFHGPDGPGEGLDVRGPVFGKDLASIYALSSVVVVPSLSDPWALVVNEAMAAGRPVIVSDGCGVGPTLVRDAENGWCYPRTDAGALARLLLRFSLLPNEVRERMGARSAALVGPWGLDRFADAVIEVAGLPPRPPAAALTRVAARLWKGRVRVH